MAWRHATDGEVRHLYVIAQARSSSSSDKIDVVIMPTGGMNPNPRKTLMLPLERYGWAMLGQDHVFWINQRLLQGKVDNDGTVWIED